MTNFDFGAHAAAAAAQKETAQNVYVEPSALARVGSGVVQSAKLGLYVGAFFGTIAVMRVAGQALADVITGD